MRRDAPYFIRFGLGQCIAQIVAAQLFNARKGLAEQLVYGVVSKGTNWKFIFLENQVVKIDMKGKITHS